MLKYLLILSCIVPSLTIFAEDTTAKASVQAVSRDAKK